MAGHEERLCCAYVGEESRWLVPPHHTRVIKFSTMLTPCRIALLTLFVISAAQAQSVPTSVLGKGWGLDHILIGLSDPAVAKETFGTKLGFSVVHGTRFPAPGLEQAIIQLPPAYIELLWPYQKPTKPVGLSAKLIAKRIESGGGPAAYNIDVSPASEAAAILRELGLTVTLPPSTRISSEGKEEPGPWQSVTISTEDTYKSLVGVPGGLGVGFGEYRDNPNHLGSDRFRLMREGAEREVPDARRSQGEIHANTARKLVSVWVAVPNVVEAVKQSEHFGFAPGAERQLAILGARGREVACGIGSIIFWEPVNNTSVLAALIKQRGLGPIGISVGVADLRTAHQIAEEGTQSKLGIDRNSFLVPGDLVGGTWIEFVQQ